jgi:hypothetical protein
MLLPQQLGRGGGFEGKYFFKKRVFLLLPGETLDTFCKL